MAKSKEVQQQTPDLTSIPLGKFSPGQVVEHTSKRGQKLVIVAGPRLSRLNHVQYTVKTPEGKELPVLEENLIA